MQAGQNPNRLADWSAPRNPVNYLRRKVRFPLRFYQIPSFITNVSNDRDVAGDVPRSYSSSESDFEDDENVWDLDEAQTAMVSSHLMGTVSPMSLKTLSLRSNLYHVPCHVPL